MPCVPVIEHIQGAVEPAQTPITTPNPSTSTLYPQSTELAESNIHFRRTLLSSQCDFADQENATGVSIFVVALRYVMIRLIEMLHVRCLTLVLALSLLFYILFFEMDFFQVCVIALKRSCYLTVGFL